MIDPMSGKMIDASVVFSVFFGFFSLSYNAKNSKHKRIEQRRIKSGFYAKPRKSERHTLGICAFCNNPIKPGYKICETHYQKRLETANSENTKKAREKLKQQGVFMIWGLKDNGKV